jgi:two-component system, NarL family, nitrate/nitrite response regulator NarL
MSQIEQKTIQILLVDDHALFRQGLARLLIADPEFEVVADCESVEEALDVVKNRPIDIVLLDFYLGNRNSKEFLQSAQLHGFTGKMLLVTVGIDESNASELIHAGVSGIFLKRDSATLLSQAIRHVVGGGVWFKQDQLHSAIVGHSQNGMLGESGHFTVREQQVLSYVFEGFSNDRIAEQIGVSTGSVKATMQQLFSKTGVRTRSQLVRRVLEHHRDQL